MLRRLDVRRVEATKRHLSEVIAQSPSGAGLGSAVSGSPEERALAEVIALELEKLGLEVRRERFPVRAFDLPGADVSEEWVAVTSHPDRWFQGAQDDAVGVAVVLELARVLAARPSPPRRSHLFVSFGSEETGGADVEFDWLRGSHAFVEAHPEITSRLAYVFNVDGAGWPAERGYFYGTLEASAFHRKLLEDAGLSERVTLKRGVTDWVDAWTLAAVGGASAGYLLWFEAHGQDGPGAFSPYYHRQHDRYDVKPYANLAEDLRLATLSLLRAERLMSHARSDWSRAFDQNPKPAAHDILALYHSLQGDRVSSEAVKRLRELEIEALAGCREALFVITGKLEKAASILRGESVLGAPPIARQRR